MIRQRVRWWTSIRKFRRIVDWRVADQKANLTLWLKEQVRSWSDAAF
jgi:hypothetical protein